MSVFSATFACLLPGAVLLSPLTLAGAAQPATTPPGAPPLPAPRTVRAYDRHSDDGSTIIVEWARPKDEPKGITYVIEMARSKEDFAAGAFKTQPVKPSEGALKSSKPKYFGFAKGNRESYFAEINPAQLLRAQEPLRLTGERVRKLLASKALSQAEADRALAALQNEKPKHQLTDQESAEREWLEWLETYLDRAEPLDRLVREGFGTLEQSDRARKALRNRKPDDKLTAEEKLERQWLGRLEEALARRAALRQFVRKGLLSEGDFDRAAKALRNLEDDAKLAEGDRAERAWVEWLSKYLPRRQTLERFRSRGVLTSGEFDRAAKALENRKPDEKLTGQERSDRKWLERLQADLTKKEQDADEAEQRKTNRRTYYFRLGVRVHRHTVHVARQGQPLILQASAAPNVFARFKLNNLVFALIFSGIVVAFIRAARRNPNLFIRKIAGLEAVEEAIGRATEMGRSVYFVHGLGAMSGLATIAAVNILSRVARRAAEYDTRVRVMNNDPIVTAVSQEVVQQAYTEAGRPDAYDADDVSLVAYDQFSYVAAVGGRMVRERPAAIFLMGYFFAESLLLAETGASTGAIQIAGTDSYTQLPFFVTTCDYTLIGEELYAASAYLSREPKMLGSLRGQDIGKAFLMLAMVAGAGALTVGLAAGADLAWLRDMLFTAF